MRIELWQCLEMLKVSRYMADQWLPHIAQMGCVDGLEVHERPRDDLDSADVKH